VPGNDGVAHQVGKLRASFSNLRKVLCILGSGWNALLLSDGDIAQIFDGVAQGIQARVQTGKTESAWPHVDAAAACAQIERSANNCYGRVTAHCSSDGEKTTCWTWHA
jgi:hypothetical protein